MTSDSVSGPKRIYRSENNRLIAGVCAGLGNYLNIDPVIIRLIWIVLAFATFGAVLLYLLAWLIIPREPFN